MRSSPTVQENCSHEERAEPVWIETPHRMVGIDPRQVNDCFPCCGGFWVNYYLNRKQRSESSLSRGERRGIRGEHGPSCPAFFSLLVLRPNLLAWFCLMLCASPDKPLLIAVDCTRQPGVSPIGWSWDRQEMLLSVRRCGFPPPKEGCSDCNDVDDRRRGEKLRRRPIFRVTFGDRGENRG